jgi:multidrug resistance efflux pump
MTAAILVIIAACAIFWLVFFKLKLLRLTPGWAIVFSFVVLHLFLVFLIGLRFVTPNSANATVVQHTIQLIPRLPEPTLVTAVLVEENVLVKKGQPLFQFDRRPYEYKVWQLEAQLAQAKQNVKVLKADMVAAAAKAARLNIELKYQQFLKGIYDILARDQAVREDDIQRFAMQVGTARAAENEALAELDRARLNYEAEIGGVNTSVANMEAQLRQAQYYLDNTTLVAPEDGRIINLQVRPGMVSGIYRIGGIAALIADADRYLLATFYQENLKYVLPGQPVEVALDLYPGQIFAGKVDSIWRGNGAGQYLPSDEIPKSWEGQAGPLSLPSPPNVAQRQYAVKILLDDLDQSKFPIGAQGSAAIYTGGEHGAWAALRKISIRAHSWFNWLYPINF